MVQVIALSASTVNVKWISEYNPNDVDHFLVQLYRGHAPHVDATSMVANSTVPGTSPTSETFTGLTAGQTYTATVQACYTGTPDTCGSPAFGTSNTRT